MREGEGNGRCEGAGQGAEVRKRERGKKRREGHERERDEREWRESGESVERERVERESGTGRGRGHLEHELGEQHEGVAAHGGVRVLQAARHRAHVSDTRERVRRGRGERGVFVERTMSEVAEKVRRQSDTCRRKSQRPWLVLRLYLSTRIR